MTPAAPAVELARHAWDFRDAAVGAEHLLGERIEYQNQPSLPVACLFGKSIELALRAYVLATDPSSTRAASTQNSHDLASLYDEAKQLGLARLLRIDDYELELFRVLGALCSKPSVQYVELGEYDIPPLHGMKKLCEKLIEIACVEAGYERVTYE